MPEFPEVYTIVTDLNKELAGHVLFGVTVLDKSLARPSPEDFKKLIGKKVVKVTQIAKHIVFSFEHNIVVIFHLRMTGRLLLRSKGVKSDLHQRLLFDFGNKELRFIEVRRFGYAEVYTSEKLNLLKKRLAPTPFELDELDFAKRIRTKKTIIKRVLLDQEVVSGIGNIYANDSLWLAKIHPETQTKELSDSRLKDLLEALKKILQEGINHRGSTLEDESYVDIYGNKGSHQNHFRVYNKEGKGCLECGKTILQISISGRSSFYCPGCQSLEKISNLVLGI